MALITDTSNQLLKSGQIELEQVGSTDLPLAVYRLYSYRHRQLHRHGIGRASPPWVVYSPLLPLFLLLFTGLYLFVLPYAARWRAEPRPGTEG